MYIPALTIGIADDEEPEDNELICIQLQNPQGGATVGADDKVTVIIQANDYVAGLLSFTPSVILAAEGEFGHLCKELS